MITIDELKDNLNYEYYELDVTTKKYRASENTPIWVYNTNYYYWTMSSFYDSTSSVWVVLIDKTIGSMSEVGVYSVPHYSAGIIRPVITIKKSALES